MDGWTRRRKVKPETFTEAGNRPELSIDSVTQVRACRADGGCQRGNCVTPVELQLP